MMLEKFKEYFKKFDDKNKKKIENLVYILILLIITLISINIILKDDPDEVENTSKEKELVYEEIEESLEKRLEAALENIKGVGNVKVLITYSETTSIVPIYNETTTKTGEEDIDTKKEVVVLENSEVAIEKNVNPKIEGAVIVAEGGESGEIKEKIISAVEVATGLEKHKIQVFAMKVN